MSIHEIERFWAKVSDDATLKAAFTEALPESPAAEQVAVFAQSHGFEVTVDDVRQQPSAAGELSEDALDAVAGGGDVPPQDPLPPVEDPMEYPPEEDPGAVVPPEEETGGSGGGQRFR